MTDKGRTWLELGERYADGWLEETDRRAALDAGVPGDFPPIPEEDVERVRVSTSADYSAYFTLESNMMTAVTVTAHNAAMALGIEGVPTGNSGDAWEAEGRAQANLVREVFGHVVRTGGFPSIWKTRDVVSLANAAYVERDPTGHLDASRLAILSDALEEASCTDTEVLSHLRSPGPHVRGCWALDLILGRQ
jgi:hypothetical protein